MSNQEVVIDFSSLDENAKQKYLSFLIENSIPINQTQENYVAKIKVSDQQKNKSIAQQHKARFSKFQPTNFDLLGGRAFTPAKDRKLQTKERKVSISEKKKDSSSPYSRYNSQNSHSSKKRAAPTKNEVLLEQGNSKFGELEMNYPLIMVEIKYKDLLSRPLKWASDELIKLIEEIYHKKFQEQSQAIKKSVNLTNTMVFQIYVYKFLTQKFKQQKQLTQIVINFLSSVDLFASKNLEVQIFQRLMKELKNEESLTFLLFLRTVIQKQLNLQFFQPLKKQSLDLLNHFLSLRQMQDILEIVYGSSREQQYQDIVNELKKELVVSNKKNLLSVSLFTLVALQRFASEKKGTKKPQYHVQQKPVATQQVNQNVNELLNINAISNIKDDSQLETEDANDYEYILNRIQSMHETKDNSNENHELDISATSNLNKQSIESSKEDHVQEKRQSLVDKSHNEIKKQMNYFKKEIQNAQIEKEQWNEQISTEKRKSQMTNSNLQSTRFALSKLKKNFQSNLLQQVIIEKLECKISDFVEDMLAEIDDITEEQKQLCRNQVEDTIQDVVASLLDSIFKFDKMIWLKKINLSLLDETYLIYIENIQKMFRQLSKMQMNLITDEQITHLCLILMQVTIYLINNLMNRLQNQPSRQEAP